MEKEYYTGLEDDLKTCNWYQGAGEIESFDQKLIKLSSYIQVQTEVELTPNLFNETNLTLLKIYSKYKRVIIIIDKNVETLFGNLISNYFISNHLHVEKIILSGDEGDKNFDSVIEVLRQLSGGQYNVARSEPVLVIGGGTVSDISGLACSLLNRRTPYIMIPTTLVAAIDAGPSPRTGVNAKEFKNSFGSFHAPVKTFIDPFFFETLDKLYIREGISEMIKISIVSDIELFDKLSSSPDELTKNLKHYKSIGVAERDSIDNILFHSLTAYLSHEGPNMFETRQNRPHAFGHTWSPKFEVLSNLRHGEAVAVGMALGSMISKNMGFLTELEFNRIIQLLKDYHLPVYHDIINNNLILEKAMKEMTQKRGGLGLWAPIPNKIGECIYLRHIEKSFLKKCVSDLQKLVQ